MTVNVGKVTADAVRCVLTGVRLTGQCVYTSPVVYAAASS